MTKTKAGASHDTYHHGDLRNALVQAGLSVLMAQGAANVTLREVARAAGVSHAAPYHHFSDKTALLAAIAETGFSQLADLQAQVPAHLSAPERLRKMAHGYVEFALANRDLFRLMFSQVLGHRTQYPSLYALGKLSLAALIDVIVTGQRALELRPGDPSDLAQAYWSLMHGWAVLLVEDQMPPDIGQGDIAAHTNALVDSILSGIQAPRAEVTFKPPSPNRQARHRREPG
jgi:AcrR family transcriptional regulator